MKKAKVTAKTKRFPDEVLESKGGRDRIDKHIKTVSSKITKQDCRNLSFDEIQEKILETAISAEKILSIISGEIVTLEQKKQAKLARKKNEHIFKIEDEIQKLRQQQEKIGLTIPDAPW